MIGRTNLDLCKIQVKKLEYFIVAIFVLIFLVILYVTTPHLTPSHTDYSLPMDHHSYIAMALDPFKLVNAPFTYRILPSLIAWLLPFELTINFQIITLISLFCTGIILYDLYRQYFDALLAFTGITLFFSLEFAARFLFYDFWLPDASAFFFMTLCFWAITKSKLVTYSISLTIGVLCKEIVLFTIPVFLIFEFSREKINKESSFRVIKGIVPALLLFVVLRVLIVPASQIDSYDYFLLLQTIGIQRLTSLPNSLYRYTITTWGLILFVYPLFTNKNQITSWIKHYSFFLVLIYAQLLIAVNTERLLVAGFFPVIFLCLKGIQNLSKDNKLIETSFVAVSILYFGYRLITNVPFNSSDPIIYHFVFLFVALGLPLCIKFFINIQQGKTMKTLIKTSQE